ncbi:MULTISPECIES: alginate export family protein [Methylosinus]|uniref:alginate export family protein n=1 Tax=Methylosinus TaxID=425 RepID=UPI0002E2A669|nr:MULTISPECIES: alginate export family protein [Methylosinus]
MELKRIVASVAAYSLFCPLGAGSAIAAEPSAAKSAGAASPPMWTGFHAGLNGGYGWSSDTKAQLTVTPLEPPLLYVPPDRVPPSDNFARDATRSIARSASGAFIGGLQLGYDWAFGERYVVGVEADFQGSVGGHGEATTYSPSTVFVTANQLDYLGTLRGRLGVLATPSLLVYGTAGAAYGGPATRTQITQPGAGVFGGYGESQTDRTRLGWAAGAGVEWMFDPKWSLKAEYLHYDLGSIGGHTLYGMAGGMALSVGDPLADPVIPYAYLAGRPRTPINGHILRAGVNYHFDGDPSSLLRPIEQLDTLAQRFLKPDEARPFAAPMRGAKTSADAPTNAKSSYYVATRAYRLEPAPDIPSYVRNLSKIYEEFEGLDWLDIGFDNRVRFESRKNDYRPWTDLWAAATPTQKRRYLPNSPWLSRTRLYLGVHDILDPFRFAFEVQDSRVLNNLYQLQGNDIDTADLITGYGELHFKDMFGADDRGNARPLFVRAGRFHFELLDKRLIAENEFRNTTNSFDGFRLKIGKQENDWDVDSFLMRPVNRDPYNFDRPDWQNWIYGTVVSIRRWSEYAILQPYFLGRKQYADPSSTTASLRVHRETLAPGLRVYGVLGDFDYDMDVNKQFGEVGEFHTPGVETTVQQDALAYAFEVGYTFPDHPWKPRVSANYAYGTGNKNLYDNANQTFDIFYGFNQPFSRNDYFAWNNIRAPKVRLEFSPAKDLQIDSAFGAFWLASAVSPWDRANLSASLGDRGTFVGTEVDVRLRYKLSRFVNLSASYSRFWPGSFTTSFAPPFEQQPFYPLTISGETSTTNGLTARPTDFFYLEMSTNAFGDGTPITGNPALELMGLAREPDKQPKAPPPSWQDIYVGVNLGGAFANARTSVATAPTSSAAPSAPVAAASAIPSGDVGLAGFVGGFQIGGNQKLNARFVAGLEADLRGSFGNSGSRSQFGTSTSIGNTFLSFGQTTVRLNYLGTIRPRLGYLVTPDVQLYATGGLAFAGLTSSAEMVTDRVGGITTTVGDPLYQDTRLGWTAGGGVEWALAPNWTAKAEYLHYDLGQIRVRTDVAHPAGFYSFAALGETQLDGHLLQFGVNRHFDWPVKN